MTELDTAIRAWVLQQPWLGVTLVAIVLAWAIWKASARWRLRRRNRRTRHAFAAREERHWRGHRLTRNAPRRPRRLTLIIAGAILLAGLIGLALSLLSRAATQAAEASAQDNPVLVGTVIKVTDGDTIKVRLASGPITVRFDSIDAPESNQPWGKQATAALKARLDGQEVVLDVVTQDRYERLVAVVYRGDENINAWLVKQGHAWAYRRYAKDGDYCVWEQAARSLRRGLWSQPSTEWVYPSEWRKARRNELDAPTDYSGETAANCMAVMGK